MNNKKYKYIRSKNNSNKSFRIICKSELKQMNLDNFITPIRDTHTTYTWWDCKPMKQKVW